MSYCFTSEARVAPPKALGHFLSLKQQLNGALAAQCQVKRLVKGVQTAQPAIPGNRERGETCSALSMY